MSKGKRKRKKRSDAARSCLPSGARGFELKLARAEDHLQDVNEQVQRWIDQCLQSLVEEPDPEEARYFCAWIDAPTLDVQLLALSVGDCLQCLRSALDHLAFELASAFTVPMTDGIEKDSAFPILSDVARSGDFGQGPHKWLSARAKVRGMDPAAQAVIESLQPYKRGQSYDTDPLWRLGELNNIDKHRVLHVVGEVMTGAILPNVGWFNVKHIGHAFIHIPSGMAAEGRTLVARWPADPIDPGQKMYVGFSPALDVVFDSSTPLVGGRPVLEVLGEMRDHVVGHVLPRLVTFVK